MTTRQIGTDDVSVVSFGAMGLHAFYGKSKTQKEADEVFNHLLTFGDKVMIDTSDIYSNRGSLGENEEAIGTWLASTPAAREKVFLATKHVFTLNNGERGIRGGKDYALEACEASLKRLQTDKIDLYYAHRPTPDYLGTQEGFKELKKQGKIRYCGVSEYNLEQLEKAEKIEHIDALQIELSPWTPDIVKNGILDWCKKNNVTVVAYSPIGRGFLSGAIKSRDDLEENDFRRHNDRFSEENFAKNLQLVDELKKLGKKHNCTAAQISLAWVIAQGDNIIPIPGSTKVQNITENMEAAKIKLSKDELKEIDDIINSFKVSGDRYSGAMKNMIAF